MASIGRLLVVLTAAAVFLDHPPAVLLTAGVLFVCLERSFAVAYIGLGPAAAAAAGAIIGLTVMLLLSLYLTGWALNSTALAETALAICLLVPLVDRVVRMVIPRRRVLIVGRVASADHLDKQLCRERKSAFRVIDVLDERTAITNAARARTPDIVVADAPGMAEFFEQELRRVRPHEISPTWLADLPHVRPGSLSQLSQLSKRAFDILVAVLGLLVTAPLWALIALATAGADGSLFFCQLRVGEDGEPFTMYKFRTMRPDAEPEGEAVWALPSDPRVRFGGRFLRDTHLDELPQLWNVLKGDMSIVGPRPERPEFVAMLELTIPHWNRRQLIRPGITGWAQVRQGHSGDWDGSEEKLSYDLWYLRHRTLLLDLAICLQTLSSMLLGSR